MGRTPTVKVHHPTNPERCVIINESDFDPGIHVRFDPDAASAPPSGDDGTGDGTGAGSIGPEGADGANGEPSGADETEGGVGSAEDGESALEGENADDVGDGTEDSEAGTAGDASDEGGGPDEGESPADVPAIPDGGEVEHRGGGKYRALWNGEPLKDAETDEPVLFPDREDAEAALREYAAAQA